jgi:hypothetical protein
MKNNLFSSILATVYTPEDLRRRIELIKAVVQSKVYGNGASQVSPEEQAWLDKNVDLTTVSEKNIKEVVAELETQASKTPTLELFLPFHIPPAEFEKVARKVRSDFGTLLLNVKLDPALIAGAALAWRGIYKDYSLRKKLKDQQERMKTLAKKYLAK